MTDPCPPKTLFTGEELQVKFVSNSAENALMC
jgi:hypothetical protein